MHVKVLISVKNVTNTLCHRQHRYTFLQKLQLERVPIYSLRHIMYSESAINLISFFHKIQLTVINNSSGINLLHMISINASDIHLLYTVFYK